MSTVMELDGDNNTESSNEKKEKKTNTNTSKISELLDASSPEVLEQYRAAGAISNRALHLVLSSCRPGISIVELCAMGDAFIISECDKVYASFSCNKGQKGISFPTCVSVNEICGHNSPFSDDKRKLHFGDMVKVDLGTHINGFAAVVAHTIVLGACRDKKANCIAAAWSAAQSALRLLKQGNKNAQITLGIEKCATNFGCAPMDSVLSHEMKQYVIDFENTIISKETPDRKVSEFEFVNHSVFGIDIMISSGRGKAVDRGEKCTIYKRNVEIEYPLKMKTSRQLLKQINKKYPCFPFTMRNFQEMRSRLGLNECIRTNIVQPYPVLSEKHGEFVAQFKFTVILNPKGTIQITGLPLQMENVHPTKQIHDKELNALLSTKYDGVLPQFYDAVKLPPFEKMLSGIGKNKSGEEKKKSGNANANARGNKKKNKNNQNKHRNQRNNQNKNKNKNQNKRKKSNQQNRNQQNKNKSQKNQQKKQNQPQQPMVMDLD